MRIANVDAVDLLRQDHRSENPTLTLGAFEASTRGAIGRGSTSARPTDRRQDALSLSASAKATPCHGAETLECSATANGKGAVPQRRTAETRGCVPPT